MKRAFMAIFLLYPVMAACSQATATPQPTAVPPSPVPATFTPLPPTATASPTPTATNTPRPTFTPKPTEAPVAMDDLFAALRAAGYRRTPFNSSSGPGNYIWVKSNGYERFITWGNGSIQLQVLDDKSPDVRTQHLEEKFGVLDKVLSPEFMDELRAEHDNYNKTVGPTVTGPAAQLFPADPSDRWHTTQGEYNVSSIEIRAVPVRFSLWWRQATCPSSAAYCYFRDFPGTQFTGDASLVFYTIYIWLEGS